jgi:hypothetical protein
MSWGQGADMDRQAYSMAYANLDVAERIARQWAEEQGAEYVPFDDAGRQTDPRMAPLVKRLRDEEGLDLPTAIRRARGILSADAA